MHRCSVLKLARPPRPTPLQRRASAVQLAENLCVTSDRCKRKCELLVNSGFFSKRSQLLGFRQVGIPGNVGGAKDPGWNFMGKL